jgi:hypothetical protein
MPSAVRRVNLWFGTRFAAPGNPGSLGPGPRIPMNATVAVS